MPGEQAGCVQDNFLQIKDQKNEQQYRMASEASFSKKTFESTLVG